MNALQGLLNRQAELNTAVGSLEKEKNVSTKLDAEKMQGLLKELTQVNAAIKAATDARKREMEQDDKVVPGISALDLQREPSEQARIKESEQAEYSNKWSELEKMVGIPLDDAVLVQGNVSCNKQGLCWRPSNPNQKKSDDLTVKDTIVDRSNPERVTCVATHCLRSASPSLSVFKSPPFPFNNPFRHGNTRRRSTVPLNRPPSNSDIFQYKNSSSIR